MFGNQMHNLSVHVTDKKGQRGWMMQDERRSGQRHAVDLTVELGRSGEPRKPCRAHNLTPDGMLLENCCGILTIGTHVDLQISWHDYCWRISATVTHFNNICIGVMFNQRQSELYRTVTQTGAKTNRPGTEYQPSASFRS